MDQPRDHGPTVPAALTAGWGTAALRAGVALAGAGLVAMGLVFLVWFASDPPRPSAIGGLRGAGALLLMFHHVPFSFDVPFAAFGLEPGEAVSAVAGSVAVAPMAGTILVLVLLARGGAAVATRAGGSAIARGLHGAKVAVPYAVATYLLSLGVAFEATFSAQTGPTLDPSPVGALLWPLALGLMAGFGGGLRSAADEDLGAGSWGARLHGALAGGWRMLWLGAALSFLGLLVLAVVRSSDTRAYLQAVADAGALGGAALVGLTLLVVPSMAVWLLYPALGGCVGLSGPAGGCVISYGGLPTGLMEPGATVGLLPGVTTSGPPAGFLLFLLAPLLAVLAGGAMAASRGGASTPREGAALGAAAGAAFGILSVPAILLAQIVFRVDAGATSDPVLTGTITVGPFVIAGALLALGWGTVGGAVAGFGRGRSAASARGGDAEPISPGAGPSAAPPPS
jgi:hypothetical protein